MGAWVHGVGPLTDTYPECEKQRQSFGLSSRVCKNRRPVRSLSRAGSLSPCPSFARSLSRLGRQTDRAGSDRQRTERQRDRRRLASAIRSRRPFPTAAGGALCQSCSCIYCCVFDCSRSRSLLSARAGFVRGGGGGKEGGGGERSARAMGDGLDVGSSCC